jgi:homeobox protein cut-like
VFLQFRDIFCIERTLKEPCLQSGKELKHVIIIKILSVAGKGPGSKLFPPPPLQHIGGDDLTGSLSPLQRMASITNSLVSQPNLSSQSGQPHRTHRAILPPITQQQFDRFQHLNTDDVVRRVSGVTLLYTVASHFYTW